MGPKWLWVLVLMTSVLVLEAGLSNGCLEQERFALLRLKSHFTDPHHSSNRHHSSNWTEEEGGSDCCQWKWVECNITTRRVTTLSLNYTTIYSIEKWYLDVSLFLPFEELRSLNLESNYIAGFVKNEGFEKLSKLICLEEINLRYNLFNNNILADLSGFSNLKSLNLEGNQLKGSIHIKEFCAWSNLENLDISDNEVNQFVTFKGFGKLCKLIRLEEINLSYNLFNNSILADLSGFSNLKSLNVRSNQLKGSIHIKEFCAWSNLESLDMSYNEVNQFVTFKEKRCLRKLKILYLDGVFTKQSFSLVSLLKPFSSVKSLILRRSFYLNKTVVTQELHVLSKMEDLILDHTPLDINILQSIGSLTSLKTLSLFNCSLNGTLPAQGWCYLKNLEELRLNENALGGAITSCLGNLIFLRHLDISDNRFIGNIASTPLTNLTMLQYLSLSNNHFQVPLSFKSFANHSNLKFLFSGGNKLIAEPDFHIWSPKFQLKTFSLSNCIIEEKKELQLPNFFYYQYDLRYVDISNINFGQLGFPNWLIENNTRLEALYMADSSIMGPLFLPSHPNSNLKVIDISNNSVQYQIPTNFCSIFPNLEKLFMFQNAFESNIPLCLGGMRYLTHLDMSHNHFFGGIPEELSMSRSLTFLRLSNNTLSGKMFPAIYHSNMLLGLYLDGNNFDGDMPDFSPISSSELEILDLSDNHLAGKLPRWLWNHTNLKLLALANNQFQGPIPRQLCNLDGLYFLDLSQNHLSGTIPSCSNLRYIRHVHLSSNKLSGPLSHAFWRSSSLVTLDLSENNLTGKIPDWNGTLHALSVLLLKSNQFHGKFPLHLCKLYSLSIVDLSQNKLSGPIPSCLSNLTLQPMSEKSDEEIGYRVFPSTYREELGLKIYDLIRNTLSWYENGFFPIRWYPTSFAEEEIEFSTKSASYTYKGHILDSFSGIDLSCNQLTGIIPPELGNLSEVRGLNLSHNNLTGPIPSTFSKLKQIESLDLSFNNLNGRIPPQLTELNTLEVFTVAHNNLSGPLPDMKAQFGTFDESSYMGNPFLCGPPLKNSCSEGDSPETPSASYGEDEEDSFIDMGDFYITFGVSYAIILLGIFIVLYINPYWRRAWFYFIEELSTACYFFIVDSLHLLPCFRRNI